MALRGALDYNPSCDCANGDCAVEALDKLKNQLSCGKNDDEKRNALKFITHFVGDLHQPLHTVKEFTGGNDFKVTINFCGLNDHISSSHPCSPSGRDVKFHEFWDGVLIDNSVFAWGCYVGRMLDAQNNGWLTKQDVKAIMADGTGPVDWAKDT
jgi:hypothetical protein